MRYIIDDHDKINVRIGKELEIIESYLEIEKLRYDEKLKVNYCIDISENLRDDILIPPVLIFTFVENAFKHGASNSLDNPWIKVKVFIKDSFLKIFVENSIDEEYKIKNGEGLGLKNVQKRLDLYYPNKYRYSASKQSDRYKVFLELKV